MNTEIDWMFCNNIYITVATLFLENIYCIIGGDFEIYFVFSFKDFLDFAKPLTTQDNTERGGQTSMPRVGFKPTIEYLSCQG